MSVDGSALIHTTVQLTVSPMVYAIALRPDDPGCLRAAVSLACGRWGGIGFPWLPLAEDGTVTDGAEKLCDVLDVAGVIDLTRSDDRAPVPPGIESLGLPVGTVDGWDLRQVGLPVRGVVPAQPSAHLVSAGEMDDADLDPVALLGLGYLSPDERSAWEAIGQGVQVTAAGGSLASQLEGRSAVGMTAGSADDFVGTSTFGISTALVWVVPDNFTLPEVARDLAGFWNYRALRLRHRETVTVIARLSSLREEGARRRLVKAVSATALSTPTCVFNGLAVTAEELREMAEALGFRMIPVNDEWKERHYRPEEPVELTAVVDNRIGNWWLRERHTGAIRDTLAIAGSPRWQARVPSPLRWRYPEALGGLVSARIGSPVITGPRTDTVAALYVQNGRWRADGVRIFTLPLADYSLDIAMPDPAAVLGAALAARNVTFTISDKGREIDGVLAASHDLGLFRRLTFHAVTAALTPPPSPRIERALNRLADQISGDPETTQVTEELRNIMAWARAKPLTLREITSHPAVSMHKLGRSDVSAVLTEMVACGLVRRGYDRRCGLCGLSELVDLTAAAAVPKCAGCGQVATYAVRDGEPELHYALGSLLQRVSKNAGLAPLAAAAAFRQQGYYIIPGAELVQSGEKSETDLLGWKDHRLLVGEAKAAASLFTDVGIARHLEYSPRIGATTYILICPQILPTPLVEAAMAAAGQGGIELLQLTGPALTSGTPPQHAFFQVAAERASRPALGASAAYAPVPARDPQAITDTSSRPSARDSSGE